MPHWHPKAILGFLTATIASSGLLLLLHSIPPTLYASDRSQCIPERGPKACLFGLFALGKFACYLTIYIAYPACAQQGYELAVGRCFLGRKNSRNWNYMRD